MEKGVFLGVPKNPIFVGLRRIFFGRSHDEYHYADLFLRFCLSKEGSLLTQALSLGTFH
jgi:hypothetical protein